MSNQIQNPNAKAYDLAVRTGKFGEATIDFVKMLPKNALSNPLISQVVRSGTSVAVSSVMERST